MVEPEADEKKWNTAKLTQNGANTDLLLHSTNAKLGKPKGRQKI